MEKNKAWEEGGSGRNDWGHIMNKFIYRLEDEEDLTIVHGEQRLALRKNGIQKYRHE
jgi:hypothetical protein